MKKSKIKIRIAFIPLSHCNKEADAIVSKVVELFNEGLANQILTTASTCIPQLLKAKGIPVDKITFLPAGREADPVKILRGYLKEIPKMKYAPNELPIVHIITPDYCSMRIEEKFSRAKLDALIDVIPAICRELSLRYGAKLLRESLMIFRDIACT